MILLSRLCRLFIFLSSTLFNSEIYGYNILPISIVSHRDVHRVWQNSIFRRTPKTRVYIHLEKFNERYNLLHIGVSFSNKHNNVRYDFRAIDNHGDEISDYQEEVERNPIIDQWNRLVYDNIDLESRTIFWGISNKSISEIMLYEKTLHKRYILGFYDCRHYVNRFTAWCLDKPTPIWTLHRLWNGVKYERRKKKENYKKRRIWRWFYNR